jgi:hypothetical protein
VAAAVGVIGVAALAGTAIVLAGSGGSDTPATIPSASSAPAAEQTAPAAAASANPTSSLNLAQARLADVLNPFELRDCRPSPVEGNFNADAALVCTADDVGEVRALHYFDADALKDEVERRSGAVQDVGRCVDGEDSVESWGRSTRRLGTLVCFSKDGGSHLFWTVDEELVAFEVSGPDGVALVSWWRRFEPLA